MMERLTEFLAMGGYAPFVWGAFGITVVVLIGLFITSLRTLRQRETMLDALESTTVSPRRRRSRA